MKKIKVKFGEFLCKRLGWHKAPTMQGFDGCSFTGTCPRCGAYVLQDSQGNWFACCKPEKNIRNIEL